MILFRLFFEFFKIGLFAVGGGMATIPFLQDLSLRTGWYSQELITDTAPEITSIVSLISPYRLLYFVVVFVII